MHSEYNTLEQTATLTKSVDKDALMKYENERASNKDNMEVKTMEGNILIFIHIIIMIGSAICLFSSFLSILFFNRRRR